ncbi:PaaI family thioesterase [Marinibaculum pumilum]|uniref:PaaI family thioesterase n=1 Tax=Marinibaculum pumilum TaxID=1766165 RepID=A0ABV7KZZ7_9PROT
MTQQPMNPDREAIRAFVVDPSGPVPMPTNPLLAAFGAELLALDREARVLTMRFTPQPLFWQGAGVVQGGALAAMLDFVMGFAGMAVATDSQTITTTSLTTSFYAAARSESYTARGVVAKPGRRVMFATAELEGADGRAVAAATSTLLVLEG